MLNFGGRAYQGTRVLRSVSICLMCFLPCFVEADQTQMAQQLLNYFGSNCSSYGDWSKGAVSQAQALITTLEALQKDPACQTTAGALAQLGQLKDLTYRLSYSSTETEILALEKMEQELLLSLTNATVDERPDLLLRLHDVQLQLAQMTGYQSANQSNLRLAERRQSLDLLVAGSQTLLEQTVANQQCWSTPQGLGILPGIAALAGATMAAATPASIALPLRAGVQLTGEILDFGRRMKIGKQMDKISQGMQATAYQCVYENLSQMWCGANDTIKALDLKAASIGSTKPEGVLWEGIRILDQDLPIVLDWLQQVRAGVEPANLSAAEEQDRVLKREQKVKSARPLGVGIIEGSRLLHQKASNKWVIEKVVITDILSKLGIGGGASYFPTSDTSGNPMSEIYDPNYAGYYLLGLSRSDYQQIKTKSGGMDLPISSFDPATQWPRSPGYMPDLDGIKGRLDKWIDLAEEKIQDEFSQVFQIDPQQIVTDAVTENMQKRSPKSAILRVNKFLKSQLGAVIGLPNNYKGVYQDTITRLDVILQEIEDVFNTNSPKDPAVALKNIHSQAKLNYGVIFIGGRLERSIRLSLNSLVQGGTGLDQDLAAQFLAAGNIVSTLQRYTGKDLTSMKIDAENSQTLTQTNLKAFTDLFGKQIHKVLEYYAKQAQDAHESVNGPNTQMKDRLCFKLLAAEKWPKDVPFELCAGAQLKSIYFPKGPVTPVLTPSVAQAPLRDRMCIYSNFLRASRIFGL